MNKKFTVPDEFGDTLTIELEESGELTFVSVEEHISTIIALEVNASQKLCDWLLANVPHLRSVAMERDKAIAHDRQPYPTAWAYEQVCQALEEAKAQFATLEAKYVALSDALTDARREVEYLHSQWQPTVSELHTALSQQKRVREKLLVAMHWSQCADCEADEDERQFCGTCNGMGFVWVANTELRALATELSEEM